MGITTGPGRLSGQERRPAVDARAGAAGTRIDLDGVCRWFGAGDTVVKAVDDVNLHVDEAAFVVVLGPSGSGKTTLLNLIGVLDAPTAGTIRLAGRDLTTASRAERTLARRRTVSFIFQSFNLFPALTALENVQFGADVAGRPDAAGIAMRVLRQVGLAERASHFAHQLSGGEQQRVAIARALATGNPILLADEPTGELDFRTGVQILQLLQAQAQAGRTVLVVTHNREISRVGDRVIELSSGHIVADGPPAGGQAAISDLRWPAVLTSRALWLRWSWRDLRARWAQVFALALVVALGTGTYAALLSTSAWRTQSNDASFALLHVHDLRVALSPGSTVPDGSLVAMARRLPHAAEVAGARERLIVPTQVAGPNGVLAPGELVGTGPGPGPAVDAVHVTVGRGVPAAGVGGSAAGGPPGVVLDLAFARQNGLPATGMLHVAGGRQVAYTGVGQSPEYFMGGGGGTAVFLSQKTFAVLFTSLHAAQDLAGAPGRVNDLVLTLKPGASQAVVRDELRTALAGMSPPVSATVTTRSDIPSYRVLYDDIKGDEQLWRAVAVLVLAGAAFAALNLTTRIVEAQRREIGIGMALGVRPRLLALRPLLFAAQVALIGVLFGAGVGYLVGIPLAGVFESLLPLPVWRTPFQAGTFAQAALIGFVLPFAAAAWPVWRAVRVQPVEAIRVGHLAARGSGLAPLLRWLRLPGRGYHQIPLRNVLRTPRRSALTLLGVAAAIATLVTIIGMLDTFRATLGGASAELLRAAPARVTVSLDSYYPVTGPDVAAVRRLPAAGRVQPGLMVPATVRAHGTSVGVAAEVLPPGAIWAPALSAGKLTGGLVLSGKAADDLGVHVGDLVTFRHPRATAGGLATVSSPVPVAGISPSPMRAFAYLTPATAAPLFGLAGMTNLLTVLPAPGHTAADVQRALLTVRHVTSAQSVRAVTGGLRSSLDQFTGILNVAAAVALLLVFLIAFNTASIGTDERAREHATMIAFGLPTRTVLGLITAESVLVGALGTVIGLAAGYGLLAWLTATTIASVMPEIGVTAALSAGTVAAALLLGVVTVAAAPLFTLRRLHRIDVPSTLRVAE